MKNTPCKVYIVWDEDEPKFVNFETVGQDHITYFTYESFKKVLDNWDAILRKETITI